MAIFFLFDNQEIQITWLEDVPGYIQKAGTWLTATRRGPRVEVLSKPLIDVIPAPRLILNLLGTDIQVLLRRHNVKIVF